MKRRSSLRNRQLSDDFRRNAANNSVCRYILCDHCSGSYDRILSDGNAFCYNNTRTDPYIISNMNRSIVVLSALRIKIMIYGSQNRIMSDQNIIPDKDSALILEMTAVIHKDIPAKMNIPSKVSIKRR